jgi:NAD(P)-dependent dehydrogenase (short-subunit alcohol dehydrogenase family)
MCRKDPPVEELRFDGRVALVTGAGRGVGREYALLLAQRGAQVVVNDVGASPDGKGCSSEVAESVVSEITARGGSAVADSTSVAERGGAESVVAKAIASFGRLDILIHNAGFVDGSWEQLLDVNLNAAFWLTEAAWPTMHRQRYGRVLITTSSAGIFGTGNGPGYSPIESYGATKMGALGLGRCLAVRGRASGIQVNMISPNAFTRLAAGLPSSPRLDWVRRHSKPDLVAPGGIFLVHESCPANGQIFAVGAGRMARIFIGQTVGYVNPELTLEDVAAHFAQVCDPVGYNEPRDMDEVTEIYMQTVGGS